MPLVPRFLVHAASSRRRRSATASLVGAAALLLSSSCERSEPPGAGIAPAANVAAASSSTPVVRAPQASASSSPAVPIDPPSVSASASAGNSAGAEPEAVDPDNKTLPPFDGPELEASARDLFDAIVRDDPSKARDFFFPREPFTPLKDVANPDRYWLNLYRTYERDIHALHGKRRDWSGATFVGFEQGTKPTWVKPGDEYNKIGYHRTFGGRVVMRIDGQRHTIKIHTLISWNGRWKITHLLPFKKR